MRLKVFRKSEQQDGRCTICYVIFASIMVLIIVSVLALYNYLRNDLVVRHVDDKVTMLIQKDQENSPEYESKRNDVIQAIKSAKLEINSYPLVNGEVSDKSKEMSEKLDIVERRFQEQDREHDRKIAKQVETK